MPMVHGKRTSAKKETETLALEAEKHAWDAFGRNDMPEVHRMVERLNTLNQLARRLAWNSLVCRIQRVVDKLLLTKV